MTEGIRFQWRRTWEDKPRDFVAELDGKTVGRIYKHWTGEWLWFLQWDHAPGRSGNTETRQGAIDALAAAFAAHMASQSGQTASNKSSFRTT